MYKGEIYDTTMPRDNAQLQFLLGSSFKQRNEGKSRRNVGKVRSKGSIQSDTHSTPPTPISSKSPPRGRVPLSHTSTLEDLKNFQLDPRFTSTPRFKRPDSNLRNRESSSSLLR